MSKIQPLTIIKGDKSPARASPSGLILGGAAAAGMTDSGRGDEVTKLSILDPTMGSQMGGDLDGLTDLPEILEKELEERGLT